MAHEARHPRPLEPAPPRRPAPEWHRPAAYAVLAGALLLALITIIWAVRLGFRLADAGPAESAFSARDPVVLLVLGGGALGLFRLAERLGDF